MRLDPYLERLWRAGAEIKEILVSPDTVAALRADMDEAVAAPGGTLWIRHPTDGSRIPVFADPDLRGEEIVVRGWLIGGHRQEAEWANGSVVPALDLGRLPAEVGA